MYIWGVLVVICPGLSNKIRKKFQEMMLLLLLLILAVVALVIFAHMALYVAGAIIGLLIILFIYIKRRKQT